MQHRSKYLDAVPALNGFDVVLTIFQRNRACADQLELTAATDGDGRFLCDDLYLSIGIESLDAVKQAERATKIVELVAARVMPLI